MREVDREEVRLSLAVTIKAFNGIILNLIRLRGRSHASRECTLPVNDTLQPKLLGLLAFPEEIDVDLGIIPLRKEVLEVHI